MIYAGLGDAARTTFRVCTLGALELEVLSGFVESLERALAEAKLANTAVRLTEEARQSRGAVAPASV